MKKVYLLIILLHTAFISKAQFFQEDFSGIALDNNIAGPSYKWTLGVYGTCGGEYFFLTTDSSWECETPSGISAGTLVYPGLTNGCVKGTFYCDDVDNHTWITSPWVNCSGQSQVLLTFANLRANCGGSFRLNIYDSTTHYSIYLANPTAPNIALDTIDISAYAANKSKVAVEFYLDWGGSGQQFDFHRSTWIVDDVSLYNPICNINNQVNTNKIYNVVNNVYTFCSGDSIKLFLTQPQSNQTFQWYVNSNVINGATDSVFFTADSGLYSCMITDTCGYVFTKTLDVKEIAPLASPIISCVGNLMYCPPSTYKNIFVGSSTDPYTYQWYNNGMPIPNATTYSLSCNQFTPYYCLVTTACGTYSTDTITISQGIAPVAQITPVYPFPMCYPALTTMYAYDSTGYSFQWQVNNSNITGQTSDTFSLAINTPGFYTCVVSNPDGCSTSSNYFYLGTNNITAMIFPSGNVPICVGDSVQLVANYNPIGYTYQWLFNNSTIPFATQKTYYATQPGTYNVYISKDCTSLSDSARVQITCIGSDDIPPPEARNAGGHESNSVQLFSNNSNLSIKSKEIIHRVTLYNSLGKLISSEKLSDKNYNYSTDLLSKGVYIIQVQADKDFHYLKFVVW